MDPNKKIPLTLWFFAAIPMLAACFALYALREQDLLWALAQ